MIEMPKKFENSSSEKALAGFELEKESKNTPDVNQSLVSKISDRMQGARDWVAHLAKYKGLKVKEHFGKLTQDEFDQLLELDFEDELQDNPPIEGFFWPFAGLHAIRRLPREQKRGALDKYKNNLMSQYVALGICRVFLERMLEFDNDAPVEKLFRWVSRFSEKYSFSNRQEEMVRSLIRRYFEQRDRAKAVRLLYPDDRDLVKQLSGIDIAKSDPLTVELGAMSIYITTNSSNYKELYNGKRIDIKKVDHRAFADQSYDAQPIFFNVFRRYTALESLFIDQQSSRDHENEHQKNKLFMAEFERPYNENEATMLWEDYSSADEEHKVEKLSLYFTFQRQWAFERAKDEILAMLRDDKYPEVKGYLKKYFVSGKYPYYDYLRSIKDFEQKKHDPQYQKLAKEMLIEEYGNTIKEAVISLGRLMKKGGYTTQEAVALLTDKPLIQWTKAVKRLLEHT